MVLRVPLVRTPMQGLGTPGASFRYQRLWYRPSDSRVWGLGSVSRETPARRDPKKPRLELH